MMSRTKVLLPRRISVYGSHIDSY